MSGWSVSAKENIGSRKGRGPAVRWGGFSGPIQTAAMKPDQVFWVGDYFGKAVKEEQAGGMCFATTEELMAYLKEHPLKDKIILIKGSNGIGLHRLIPSGAC